MWQASLSCLGLRFRVQDPELGFIQPSNSTCILLLCTQDKAVKAKIDARNQLETYCYSMKNTVEDQAKDKVSAEDKKTVLDAVKEALEWVEENSDADADEYKDKLKEVCSECTVNWYTQKPSMSLSVICLSVEWVVQFHGGEGWCRSSVWFRIQCWYSYTLKQQQASLTAVPTLVLTTNITLENTLCLPSVILLPAKDLQNNLSQV